MKTFLKVLLCIVLAVVILAGGLIGWLSIEEYKPDAVMELEVNASGDSPLLETGKELSVISWNIGYAGLGKGSDFFMDGGENVQSADKETSAAYLEGVKSFLNEENPDLIMLQEVDIDSKRTYGVNQAEALAVGSWTHALNYSCPFVPFPWPPMGKINSGLFTTTSYEIESAERIALPCPFSWPVSTANLKRCLLVSYMPVEGSDSQLVLVNLHLEAYDDGEGKIAQTKMLRDFIRQEYEKGNYVIAGGDFNQTFPGTLDLFPIVQDDYWVPGVLDDSFLPEGWSFTFDTSAPTCRLLNQPYNESDPSTQHYILDGFILSPNVELLNVENADLHFENSDHNPVKLSVKLK